MSAEEAFEEYYRAHSPAVLRFVQRRVGDHEATRDICQECFAAVYERFDPEAPPPLTRLYNLAWNEVKRSYRHRRMSDRLLERLATEGRAEDADPAIGIVTTVLGQVDERHREVLELTYWDGLGAAEIAEVLGLEQPAVWQRLSRTRRAVRIILDARAKQGGAE